MPVIELFSKREKARQNAGKEDVYQYTDIPQPLRVQLARILEYSIGTYMQPESWSGISPSPANKDWSFIHDTIAHELGVVELASSRHKCDACLLFLQRGTTANVLDLLELSLRWIEKRISRLDAYEIEKRGIKQNASDALVEANYRLKEHGVGYQYVDGKIIRIDSEFIHSEVTLPALRLLREQNFQGASDEFMRAYQTFRRGDNKGAITEALKSWESTMKAVCDERGWQRDTNANASQLVKIMMDHQLVPPYLENHFNNLRTAMESGLNTIRNKTSGHGQGINITDVPDHYVAFALHLAAANIVFLVEAHRALP